MNKIRQVEVTIRISDDVPAESPASVKWEATSLFPAVDVADVDIAGIVAGLLPLLNTVVEKWQDEQ